MAKYAARPQARISISRANGHAVVEVADDGVGGADPTRGSGLRGLADRVSALDGTLELRSPAGRGDRTSCFDPRMSDPIRVVIADDSVLLREGVARLLEEFGFEVAAPGR